MHCTHFRAFPLIILFGFGCGPYWVGENMPPWPRNLEPEAYANVHPVQDTPGISGSRSAIAGGRIGDHGVYIDILVQGPFDAETQRLVYYAATAGYQNEPPDEHWFDLVNSNGTTVLLLPRERRRVARPGSTIIDLSQQHIDHLTSPIGRFRYIIVVWYRTVEQLKPGVYVLRVLDLRDVNSKHARDQLGLKAFDGMEIELRYAEGFNPNAISD